MVLASPKYSFGPSRLPFPGCPLSTGDRPSTATVKPGTPSRSCVKAAVGTRALPHTSGLRGPEKGPKSDTKGQRFGTPGGSSNLGKSLGSCIAPQRWRPTAHSRMPLAASSWPGGSLHSWQRGSREIVPPRIDGTWGGVLAQQVLSCHRAHLEQSGQPAVSLTVRVEQLCLCPWPLLSSHSSCLASSHPGISAGHRTQGSFPQRPRRRPSVVLPGLSPSRRHLVGWMLFAHSCSSPPQALPSDLASYHQAWLCQPCGGSHHIHPASFLSSGWKLINLSSSR